MQKTRGRCITATGAKPPALKGDFIISDKVLRENPTGDASAVTDRLYVMTVDAGDAFGPSAFYRISASCRR
jgi:hypothetical protein